MPKDVENSPGTKSTRKHGFSGIRGVVEGYSRRALLLIVIVNIALAAVLIGGVGYYLANRRESPPPADPENHYVKNIEKLENKPLPSAPIDQAIYYSQIGSNYETIGNKEKALQYYHKAQDIIDTHKLDDMLTFNTAIGDLYASQKQSGNAKKYYNKEIDRLEAYKLRHPDEASVSEELITQLQNKAKLL